MRGCRAAIGLLCLLALAVGADAQSYPDHAVKIIVPIGPSGSYDLLGRLVADQLSRRLNQSFVVENRPGAAPSSARDP
jgi:tripartite-type tricarboxylate transporter receptor subunit TctC